MKSEGNGVTIDFPANDLITVTAEEPDSIFQSIIHYFN